jgi:hypothetical protein
MLIGRYSLARATVLVAALAGLWASGAAQAAAGDTVQVCHLPPDNPANYHTLSIGRSALAAHLGHGDLEGACDIRCSTLCSDGNSCTLDVGAWDPGLGRCACVSRPIVCTALDQCHETGTCDPATGQCSNPVKPDGSACADGNACTLSDTCQAGSCVGADRVTCAATDQCHETGTCDPATGQCSNPVKPDGSGCADGNACTLSDTCQAGSCVGADPVTCAASDQCHEPGACNPADGQCSEVPSPDGTACDDGDALTIGDHCVSGVCSGKPPAATTCREIKSANPDATDGIYMVQRESGLVPVYCDMTTDGGGWTAVFIGANGSRNVFDHFDEGGYLGTFDDPSSSRYLQRAPAALGRSAAELAVSCGTAMVKFAVTEAARDWLVQGVQSGWIPLTPTVIAGSVANVPNTLWTGESATNRSFIFARSQGAFGNTFASTYENNPGFDYCNGTADQTSLVRVFYRETEPTPVHNTPETAGASCLEILNAGESAGDGVYWLAQPGGTPYQAYCDMTTGGGGWTAAFAGRNGTVNVFGHFDAAGYAETCTDPATRCLRRAPTSVGDSATEMAVSCGPAMVKFPLTEAARDWLVEGKQSVWIPLTPTVIAGSVTNVPNTLWTGESATNQSFIFARSQSAFGNTFASTYENNPGFDYCNGTADQASLVRVFYREATPTPVRNTPETARASCLEILNAGESRGDGVYWLVQPAGAPYQAYCDMTTGGGGWTAAFAGRNGSVNTFGHFDAPGYVETCTDPATHCLRRAPAAVGDSATEIAVSCGTAMVKFPLTEAARDWLVEGRQSRWIPLTPTVVAGSVLNVPNTLWTGESATNQSFIFARGQSAFGNTFASTYENSASFDYCNGAADQASLVRVYYREATPTPVRNTPETARGSCLEILNAHESAGDGLYWLVQPAGAPYQAYCDMTTGGGGWTAAFAGRNGSVNAFGHFDAPGYVETCTDPATHCLRRGPASLENSAAEIAVSCGTAMVEFPLTEAAREWLVEGRQSRWIPLTPTVIAGSVANVPNTLWTGESATSQSFIFARNQSAFGNTFASTYENNAGFDYCNGTADQASLVRVFYREAAPTPVRNTPETARGSCLEILNAGESAGDGVYWLAEPGAEAYQAYCDMTTGGGGWTAVFAGRNGSANVFGHFDAASYSEVCGDPATRCLRHAPPSLASASELAVSCGAVVVKFPLTPTVRQWLQAGVQAGWLPLTPTVIAGVPVTVPNTLWSGANATNQSFIFALNQGGFGNTFASSYESNAAYDYCNGSLDQASLVRISYR